MVVFVGGSVCIFVLVCFLACGFPFWGGGLLLQYVSLVYGMGYLSTFCLAFTKPCSCT